jgi:hypothetical protein
VASAKTVHATAPVQKGNGSCGANQPADPVIGSAKWKRSGNKVSLSVNLTNGRANTGYSVDVVENHCNSVVGLKLINFKTNAKGKGKGTATFEVPGAAKEFFANVYPTGQFELNETPSVSLP